MSSGKWMGWAGCALAAGGMLLGGCSHLHTKPADQYVFVTAKQANLRDRVAAVSNRTGQVNNGDRLKVLDHARHFIKVEAPGGQVGWIEEKAVATQAAAGDFDTLKDAHKDDPEVAGAVVRDQVYMHVKPGRESERFYLLNEGDKLRLLRRATLVKTATPMAAARASRAIPQAAGSDARVAVPVAVKPVDKSAEPPVPGYEDWWLARDAQGHTGWVFARMIDVDAPDALTRYAEGQRITGAYVLTKVHDEGAPGEVKDIPVYVTCFSAYKPGLPYDFDQVRVFTWSVAHHRYETGFREKNIQGYLPVEITKLKDPAEKSPLGQQELPAFRYKVLAADAPPVVPDSQTGAMTPAKTITKTYRLEGNLLRRVLAPGSVAPEEAHLVAEPKKEKKGRRR